MSPGSRQGGQAHLIELRLRDVHRLFNTMDPSPFHVKDLDDDAEEFIVSWAQEYPYKEQLSLRVHLEQWPEQDPTPILRDAIHNYFAYRSSITQLELKRLMRQGRASLAIGVVFLAACLSASAMVAAETTLAGYIRESLTIVGWVAMWRPMEIYLYDWWPVRRRVLNYTRLSTMPIEVVPISDALKARVTV